MEEMMEQLSEMVDPTINITQIIYEKMANNDKLVQSVAKFYKKIVDELTFVGFSREEAINMAIQTMASLNNNKK